MNEQDDFEVLATAYLDELVTPDTDLWIGVFERLSNEFVLRAARGTSPAASTKKWAVPISLHNQGLGEIRIEESSATAIDRVLIEKLAAQLAPLFAWQNAPWSARLKALSKILELQVKNPCFDWVGIYRVTGDLDRRLDLSVYLGTPTTHTRISVNEGICGAAIREEKTMNIPQVQSDPRFIACSLETQSELVVPIRDMNGRVVAEIDIDSNTPEAFTPTLTAKVEACALKIEQIPELF